MEPTRFKRVTDLLREAGYILSLLLSLVPILERLLGNWRNGSTSTGTRKQRTKTEQVNAGKDNPDER